MQLASAVLLALAGACMIFYWWSSPAQGILERRSKSPSLGESASQMAGSDPNFAHSWDRIVLVYNAASYFLTGALAA